MDIIKTIQQIILLDLLIIFILSFHNKNVNYQVLSRSYVIDNNQNYYL